jgi:gentisate 1,2-dioxygenase
MRIDANARFPTDTGVPRDTNEEDLARIAKFYEDLDARDLQPLWTQNQQLMPLEPRPQAIAWLWRKKTLWEMAERAGELITISRGGDRRVLALANPGLGGAPFATPTLWGAIQYLNAGESAPGHRHTPGAIRFVMEGEGTWTTVDGDACDMGEGDLVLTPPWTWHDHNNRSDRPMVWFDGLDLPLVKTLDAIFFELYPTEELQPVRGHNISERLFGGRGNVPLEAGAARSSLYSPLLIYRWSGTDAMLAALLEERGGPMASMEFVNPTTGAPVMPTLGCEMHRLVPEGRTATTRRVRSSVFVVFAGSGSSVVNGQRFDWQQGDMFVVPTWAAVDHEAHEPSDLFAITDAPVLQALGHYREQQLDQPQEVTAAFEPK